MTVKLLRFQFTLNFAWVTVNTIQYCFYAYIHIAICFNGAV